MAAAAVLGLAWAGVLGHAAHAQNQAFASARTLWADTLEKCPDNPKAMLGLAVALKEEEDLDGAEDLLRRVVEIQPDYAFAWVNLANLALARGEDGRARAYYVKALELEQSPEALYNYGLFLFSRNEPKEAGAQFSAALEKRPWMVEARLNLGVCLAVMGRLAEAEAHLQKAVKQAPDLAAARYNLGRVLLDRGKAAEAARQFEQVLRIDPSFSPARAALEKARAPGRG
ncbi:MAG: tetratricopeptide repeat protein [Deltaproteobacteria bacterium]|nr:tetratricopeptide repeat protein [Deltaproteobacteria bacterium]